MQQGTVGVIHVKRAARATFVPLRTEHEVIHNELTSTLEEIGERLLPVGLKTRKSYPLSPRAARGARH